MILLIDNYDSFSYNLFQFVGTAMMEELGREISQEGSTRQAEQAAATTGEQLPQLKEDVDFKVIRNDAMTVAEIEAMHPEGILISPGPGRPADAGVCEAVVRELGSRIPILGVCLGHQGICEAYGATITYAKELMHGKQSIAKLDTASALFRGMQEEIPVARYHSLAVDPDTIPECLRVIARTADGEVMAVQHEAYPVFGVQFHPESIMTPAGMEILRNFIRITAQY